jgi:adenosylcobinamide kinase/adenosylcobinamide-phosphate guanylyltransferase
MPAAPQTPRLTLVLGGARSGKTSHALGLAAAAGLERVYLATAQAFDEEMASRIARHRAERAEGWSTREEPFDLADAVSAEAAPGRIVLVDCLTLWLSNVMLAERDLVAARSGLLDAMRGARGPVIFVSNEVGLSIVPENALARRFRDEQGWLNQAVASAADRVVFVAAGLPIRLKG